jgi:hypothetical protein
MKSSLVSLLGYLVPGLTALPTVACVDNAFPQDELGTTSSSIMFGGHDYLFVTTAETWSDAWSRCQDGGYDLVSIESAAEQAFVTAQENMHGGGAWWIGYNDIGIEGTWHWSNTSPSAYTNWSPGEPNNWNGLEDCALDNYLSSGKWNDAGCNLPSRFVCEKNSAPPITGACSYFASNTNNATMNTVDCPIHLYEGQVLTIGTCGVPGATFSGNTYLRIEDQSAMPVGANDNACGGLGSNLSIVAASPGTYNLKAGCAAMTACSGIAAYVIF